MKRYLQVIIEVPADVSVADAKEYVRAELKAAGGCRHIDDPLFSGLEVISIKWVRPEHD